MKTSASGLLFLLFSLSFSVVGQTNQVNPPAQQQVNLYGGTNLNNNPQALNNMADNNDFVIHEEVQTNKINAEVFDQQISNSTKTGSPNFSFSGGGSPGGGNIKHGINFRRSKLRFDKKMNRIFCRSPKKKRSNTSCFSWS